MYRLSFPLALLLVAGCGPAKTERASVPSHYAFLFGDFVSQEDEPSVRALLPYEKIQLKRTQALPITLWRDGRIKGPLGEGEVNLFDYASLCYLIDRSQVASATPERIRKMSLSDLESTQVMVRASEHGEPTAVLKYASMDPVELWAIETAMEGIASQGEWKLAAQPDDAALGPSPRR